MIELRQVTCEDTAGIFTARELFQEYQRELGIDLCFQDFDQELANLPGKYGPPCGKLLLAYEEDRAVACGAVRELGDDIAELKRIYVRPEARRQGLAKRLSLDLIHFARDRGYAAVRLDTLRRLPGAIEMYRQLGFQPIESYNFNPEPDIVYMELSLAAEK